MKTSRKHRTDAVGEFWCSRFGKWFPAKGFECGRCRARLPVTTEEYREFMSQRIEAAGEMEAT